MFTTCRILPTTLFFLKALSQHWLTFLQDFKNYSKKNPLSKDIQTYVDEVNAYPKGSEFSLGFFTFSVKDSGIGFTDEEKELIF